MQMKKKKVSRFSRFLRGLSAMFASNKFFCGILAFLVATSFWVAISSLYPMAFDENFHLGIIKIYAEVWNPFAITQTPEAAEFGSLTTDPSYLFHYLMSFPYRLLAAITSSETAIVIVLRILNIALFVAGVVVYRKVFLRAKISPAIINAVMAIFVLIPVVPLLAGQINYDNLLMLIVAVVFWLTLRIREDLRTNEKIPTAFMLGLLIVLLFASVVKYAFLPIAAGVVFYLCYEIYRVLRHDKEVPNQAWRDFRQFSWALKAVLVGLLGVGIVLFSQRYVVNIIRYHEPVPDCAAVLTVEECNKYSVWRRDNAYALHKEGLEIRNPVHYTTTHWAWGMWHRLFFTLAGPTNGYATRKQLPIPSYLAIVLAVGGVILAIVYGRVLLRQYPIFGLFIAVGALYVAAVWLQVYQLYEYTARPVAINGRYLIPLLPAFGVIMAVAYARFFSRIGQSKYKGLFAGVLILLFLQGGGPVTYIVRAEPNWYWPNSFIQDANQHLQKILKSVIVD
jgi:hypothetical protein